MSLLAEAAPVATDLSPLRIHAMRGGYLLMAIGLAVVKWPLVPDARALPLYDGVTLCLLTAMSLLALLGAWRPIRMLPLLVFEVLWKALWLSLVALPRAMSDDLGPAYVEVAISCSLVVVIGAVVPWRYVWRTFVR
ncbi:hypothetical protein J2X46_001272 [Nocardioides sp. BE266]|uniref:hypothetical protein n=1 Tax=Nocardioides sp. BE266 TaxID=2817725 RepID=UPI00286746F7|nr:hypothetical protein [Nocardioides sp. BE266]MDR7252296.1 hypothetical protein [Nocardioides sp. BE266]